MTRYIFKRKSKVNRLATILPAALVILGTAILLEPGNRTTTNQSLAISFGIS
jgi:hypothetical protein